MITASKISTPPKNPMNKALSSINVDCLITDARWQKKLSDPGSLCSKLAAAVLGKENLPLEPNQQMEISVTLSNDSEMRDLNRDHRDKDNATNVLSFPTYEPDELDDVEQLGLPENMPLVLGDIIVALETTEREAGQENKSFTDHFAHLFVHGCLHLLGYDHEVDEEAEEMESREIELLSELGIANPYKSGL